MTGSKNLVWPVLPQPKAQALPEHLDKEPDAWGLNYLISFIPVIGSPVKATAPTQNDEMLRPLVTGFYESELSNLENDDLDLLQQLHASTQPKSIYYNTAKEFVLSKDEKKDYYELYERPKSQLAGILKALDEKTTEEKLITLSFKETYLLVKEKIIARSFFISAKTELSKQLDIYLERVRRKIRDFENNHNVNENFAKSEFKLITKDLNDYEVGLEDNLVALNKAADDLKKALEKKTSERERDELFRKYKAEKDKYNTLSLKFGEINRAILDYAEDHGKPFREVYNKVHEEAKLDYDRKMAESSAKIKPLQVKIERISNQFFRELKKLETRNKEESQARIILDLLKVLRNDTFSPLRMKNNWSRYIYTFLRKGGTEITLHERKGNPVQIKVPHGVAYIYNRLSALTDLEIDLMSAAEAKAILTDFRSIIFRREAERAPVFSWCSCFGSPTRVRADETAEMYAKFKNLQVGEITPEIVDSFRFENAIAPPREWQAILSPKF